MTRPVTFEGGYNTVMEHFADFDKGLAKKYNGTFVNLNPPVVAAIEKAKELDPTIAKLLLPDRVHPDPLAHWVMAEALLKGWNAPALVSSVTVDAKAGKVTEALHAVVDHVEQTNGVLRWTETEDGLPLPLSRNNASEALLLDLTDIEQELNQEPLRVTGLESGRNGDLQRVFVEMDPGARCDDEVHRIARRQRRDTGRDKRRERERHDELRVALRIDGAQQLEHDRCDEQDRRIVREQRARHRRQRERDAKRMLHRDRACTARSSSRTARTRRPRPPRRSSP